MKNFSMVGARNSLRATLQAVEAPALDYIDWDTFELELETVMSAGPNKALVMAVFSKAVNRARQNYHAAIVRGEASKPH